MNYFSWQRIKTLSQYYILTSLYNKSRLLLVIFWPVIDLLIWGFTTTYLVKSQPQSSLFLSLILGTFIFWNLTIKAQQEISCQFMADIYSRNFNNLLVTPLKEDEIVVSLILSSLTKLLLVFVALFISAFIFYSFNFLIFDFGILIFFINLLIFGWSLGIVATGLVARFGYRMDFITWTLALFIQPISCVFYPRSILPNFLQVLSWLSPVSYIFEGMRGIILKQNFNLNNLYYSILLNIFYFILAMGFFRIMLKWARKNGGLVKI